MWAIKANQQGLADADGARLLESSQVQLLFGILCAFGCLTFPSHLRNRKSCTTCLSLENNDGKRSLAAQTNAFTSFFRYNSDSSLQPAKLVLSLI